MAKAPKPSKEKPKEEKENTSQEDINQLLSMLNDPEMRCLFWKVNEPSHHIMGFKQVRRTTLEIINQNGFNPYEKKTEEILFKCFKIFLIQNNEEPNYYEELDQNGIIIIRNENLLRIIEKVRKYK